VLCLASTHNVSCVCCACAACREVFDIVLVSPRNFFLYTPLLPAVAAGSMEERSIVQPVRNIMHNKVRNSAVAVLLSYVVADHGSRTPRGLYWLVLCGLPEGRRAPIGRPHNQTNPAARDLLQNLSCHICC
jgi:hypothetical protein